jgi:PEGA domain
MIRRVLPTLLCLAAIARADQDVERAKTFYDAGRQAYEASDYVTAIRSFEEAETAAPKPFITFALAHAYRKQYVVDHDARKLKRAVALYHQYLDEVPQGGRRDDAINYLATLEPLLDRLEATQTISAKPTVSASTQILVMSQTKGATASIDGSPPLLVPVTKDVSPGPHQIHVEAPGTFARDLLGMAVEDRLVVVEASLREVPARLTLHTDAGAAIDLDGKAIGVSPLAMQLEIPAGRHQITLSERGHVPFAKTLDLHAGEAFSLDADLPTTGQRKASYWVLGGAAVFLAGGGVTTFLAIRAQSDAEDILARRDAMNIGAADVSKYYSARDRRDHLVIASTVLYGAGLAAATTGILLWLLDTPHVDGAGTPGSGIVPTVQPGELGVGYRSSF